MIERIVITGDTNRPINQFGNISFFYNLLKFQIETVTGMKVECNAATEKHLNFDQWILRETRDDIFHGEVYSENDLVIGFEISSALERGLRSRNIPFIHFDIDPIRFMSDLCIRIKSHSKHFSFPFAWAVTNNEIEFEVNVMKAKRIKEDGISFANPSVLVIGQTPKDRSVMHRGRYRWIGDYCGRIKKKFEGHHIYYKAHPYHDDAEVVCERLNAHDVSKFNIYRLLTAPELECVTGLSSSVLHEAEYFKKKTYSILPLSRGVITLSARTFLSIRFWSDVLKQLITCNDNHHEINYRDGMLRIGLGTYWGYDLFYRQDF